MLRVVIIGMLLIVVVLLLWIAWGELRAYLHARERDRHDRLGG